MMDESTVMVITPSPYMTKKIQKALEDIGGYNVITSSSPAVALEFAQKSTINTCILDVFHPEFPVLAVVKELKIKQPKMRLVLVLTDPNFTHEAIPEIIPDGLLPRSFNFEQFTAALGVLSQESSVVDPSNLQSDQTIQVSSFEQAPQSFHPHHFSQFSRSADFTNIHQRLSSLSIDITALAIIIIRRKHLLSYRSKLPYPAIQEIVDLINSYSPTSTKNLQKEINPGHHKTGSGDMVRFIQLELIQGKLLLYSIALTREMLLAVVFEPDTHFSDVRRNTIQIERELLEPQPGLPLVYRSSYPQIDEPDLKLPTQPSQAQPIFEASQSQPTHLPSETQPELTTNMASEPPQPDDQIAETNREEIGKVLSTFSSSSETGIEEIEIDSTQGISRKNNDYHESFELDEQIAGVPLELRSAEEEQVDQMDTGSEHVSDSSSSSYGSYITYSCLLIPRMPQHLLNSNLAASLFKWTGQLCLAYGWRLEHLSIHPNHIQMIAGAPLATSPAFLVRTMRQKTSQYIFTQFPPLTSENPSGDFWAPGFFISGGKQTIQPHLIDQYISEIRDNQGVNNSPGF
jgi:DNA-binding NarL/FixJ family response regulator/REP element-mobilizing transposase RayT